MRIAIQLASNKKVLQFKNFTQLLKIKKYKLMIILKLMKIVK